MTVPVVSDLAANCSTLCSSSCEGRVSDVMMMMILLLLLSFRWLVALIERRVSSWSSEQCVGDVLVKFSSSLKPFVNYFQSYAALLLNVERSTQQFAAFRALLRRRERTADTNMLT